VESGPGGGATVQNQSFLYDEIGNVTQRQDNNIGLTENFYYDGDYRLSYSTLNGTQNLFLNYDQKGNITSRSDVAAGQTWTYDPVHVHEVTQAGSSAYKYAYDANGNATSRQGSSITWTSYNYPSTVNDSATGEAVSFSYGPDRRAWLEETQSPSGTELNYRVGGLLDIVSSGGITDYRHYIYAGNQPVAIDSRKSNGTNTFSYLLSDQEGSIADITNSSGGVVVGEGFTAYGSRRNPTTWSGAPSSSDLTTIAGITRHGYTFQEALGEMGLNDMVGRVQDAITGRFLSADPTIPHPMDPQSYNPYSYVRNTPLTYTDPTGFGDVGNVQWYNGPWDNMEFTFEATLVPNGTDPATTPTTAPPSDSTTESGEFGEINIQGTRLPPDGTQSYNGAQIGTVGARGSTGAATGSGGGQNGNSPSSSQQQTPQKPQSNPSQSGCAYIACPVVQAFKEPPPPFALSPAVTPALIALDYDENFLQRTLEALGLLTRVSVVSLQLYNATGDPQDGPIPPEAGTPEPQTTEQPYNPGPPVRFNPQTGEMQFSGRVGELPPEFFEVPF
jgi:RHS repeat-associated protein